MHSTFRHGPEWDGRGPDAARTGTEGRMCALRRRYSQMTDLQPLQLRKGTDACLDARTGRSDSSHPSSTRPTPTVRPAATTVTASVASLLHRTQDKAALQAQLTVRRRGRRRSRQPMSFSRGMADGHACWPGGTPPIQANRARLRANYSAIRERAGSPGKLRRRRVL